MYRVKSYQWICLIVITALFLGLSVISNGFALIEISYDYSTIQEGIDAADPAGDTVLVYPGTYSGSGNRNLDFSGKPITVRSVDGPAYTVIDCDNATRAVNFTSLEGPDSVLEGFTIANGYYSLSAGAIMIVGSSPLVDNCILIDNSCVWYGGAIYCLGASPTISNCTITSNASHDGAGIYCYESTLVITGCTIEDNTAANDGGGLGCLNSDADITDCDITGNTANEHGGGIYFKESPVTIENCSISYNTTNLYDSGGIYGYESSPSIADCSIFLNSGCGMKFEGGNPTVFGCNIFSNAGSGIVCHNADALITYCYINENHADLGGGILCRSSSPVIDRCWIFDNIADNDGGGIYCTGSSPTVINSVIALNEASGAGGGLAFGSQNFITTEIIHSTISGNSSSSDGGIFSLSADTIFVKNSILWDDSPDEIVRIADVTNSDVEGGWSGPNIDVDPEFMNPLGHDYSLYDTSPCIDAAPDEGIFVDIELNMRPLGVAFDMGAYEGFDPEVAIEITYITPLVEKPGEVKVSMTATNSENFIVTCDVFTRVQTPLGTWHPPSPNWLFGPYSIQIPAMGSVSGTLKHDVPGGIPVGTYIYQANLGMLPATYSTDIDSFSVQ